ncbi:hypothetical protein GCM10023084_52510 [Streptomyces lacrimifluminis]|uniref:Uncharacterized protein n=1 Tax=Streptomyces lacrimifluminis TaxID=1500077 RepID=A0A917P200_9ACTN|nr:hypothetical protein [Streptomyces lacrimifluminis]GGJ54546.1 hypothetical protein GCM10012282_59630 [Streptomyces lacrimifluminis]
MRGTGAEGIVKVGLVGLASGTSENVTLTADLVGDAAGGELVDVARRFVAAMRTGDRP